MARYEFAASGAAVKDSLEIRIKTVQGSWDQMAFNNKKWGRMHFKLYLTLFFHSKSPSKIGSKREDLKTCMLQEG